MYIGGNWCFLVCSRGAPSRCCLLPPVGTTWSNWPVPAWLGRYPYCFSLLVLGQGKRAEKGLKLELERIDRASIVNWLKNHLNWALVLGLALVFLLALLFMPLWLFIGETGETIFYGYVLISPFLALAIIGWHLRQKGRSLFNLFWLLLTTIGIIIILCLENKRKAKPA